MGKKKKKDEEFVVVAAEELTLDALIDKELLQKGKMGSALDMGQVDWEIEKETAKQKTA